jgi:hypothetical protein
LPAFAGVVACAIPVEVGSALFDAVANTTNGIDAGAAGKY